MRIDEKQLLGAYQGNKDISADYFQTQSAQIVKQTAKKIQVAQVAHQNMKDVFYQLIDDLGRERFKLAAKQGTPEGLKSFGEFRHQPTERKAEEELPFLNTPLAGQYSEYGEKLQSLLNRYFTAVEIPITTVQVLRTEIIGGYTVNLETFPNRRGLIVFQQTVAKDGKTYVLSRYVFVRGQWSIQHQDSSEMVHMMDSMNAEAFEKCIGTSSRDVGQLKINVAVFRWLFSHATPYARGSAAIGEWFEKAIYEHLGYRNEYKLPFYRAEKGRPTVDLDALTALGLSSFIKDYNQRIQLFPAIHP
jgi:hypothetical protein